MLATNEVDHIKELFDSVYGNTTPNKKLAVYTRHEADGRLHCEVKIYFSPATSMLAKLVAAEPCKNPTRHGLSLLAGSGDTDLI